jgi:NAD(P)-dependent dehydrogenase (short-subunit alcohol dehydrogenase family)
MPIGAPMTFNARSTAEQVTEGLDLSGKVAVVTGISSGLGFETMRVLCLRRARVIGLARNPEKAREACGRVAGETMPVTCDLSDWASVLAAALVIREMDCPVDVLLCNAGTIATRKITRAHGLEMQFATNHMGHFILSYHLMDRLREARQGQSKLANLLHAVALAKRLEGSGATANAADPGVVRTGLMGPIPVNSC